MPRRLLLAFVVFLSLGLTLPALAQPGQGGGQGNGQGNGPPTTPTTQAAAPPTTVTAPGNGQGGGQDNGQGGGQDNGQGNGPPTTPTTQAAAPPTTVTAPGNNQGNGPPTTPTTQAAAPPTTVTAPGNGQGGGQDNDNGDAWGNGQNNAPPRPSTSLPTDQSAAAGTTSANDSGTAVADRIAFFLAPMQVSQEADSSLPMGVGTEQSAPDRMISWLLSPDQQRFLPVVASPLVALVVVGRALASAGSGVVAPIALLAAVALTKLFDQRRGQAKEWVRNFVEA